MTSREKLSFIEAELTRLYPHTSCFLKHKQDYELLFAVLLSAQATDSSVNKATAVLFTRYPSLQSLAAANLEELISIIRPVGLANNKGKNIKATAQMLIDIYSERLPRTREELMKLPGVGYKTASVVLAELYGSPYIPVDTHIFRIINRLNIFPRDRFSADQLSAKLDSVYAGKKPINFHRQLILFGREICSSRQPKCEICPFYKNVCRFKGQLKG